MAILIYFVGIGAIVCSDMLVTRYFTPEQIASWAEARALIAILGVFVTLGLDMVFVRTPESSGRLLRLAAVQIPIVAIIVGLGAHGMGYLSSPLVGVALAIGAGWTLVHGQYFRALQFFTISQLLQQFWKPCALVAVATSLVVSDEFAIAPDALLANILFVCGTLGWLAIVKWRPSTIMNQKPEVDRDLYAIAIRFLLTSLVLVLAIYGEQLVVNGIGSAQDAAVYFTHATYFLMPVSVASTYLGFRLGPWLRENNQRFLDILSAHRASIHVIVWLYACVMQAAGWIVWHIIDPVVGAPDILIQAAFFISAVARTFYVLPSGYNGVYGRPSQHDLLIVSQVVLLVVLTVSIFNLFGHVKLVYLVAGFGAIHWTLRTLIASLVMRRVIGSQAR